METKVCIWCGIEKDVSEYYSHFHRARNKRYYYGHCKVCEKLHRKNNYAKAADGARRRAKEWKRNNRQKVRQLSRGYRERNGDKIKAYGKKRRQRDSVAIKQYNKLYRESHKEQIREYQREYLREKLKNNIQFRITQNVRGRVRAMISRGYKNSSALELLGCSVPEYIAYIDSKLSPEMSWDNYGKVWTIDHIRPCRSFDLTVPEQQRECFNYKNTQPLLWNENRSKNDKWNGVRASLMEH